MSGQKPLDPSAPSRPGLQYALRWSVAVPAAAVTFALCLFMGRLIEVEYMEPPAKDRIELASLTPTEVPLEPRRTPRTKPQRMDDAVTPPPPPDLSAPRSDLNLPSPSIQGEAPKELEFDRMDTIAFEPVVIDNRNAKPISPPAPVYPQRAAERGIEGQCEVRLDVSPRGEPFNVVADCTDSVFARAAERAVERVRFAPMIVRGQATEMRNVVYPLVFTLED
ncbi:MAG: energy transducer TonB [Pseudomonadota bacterium]